jgi:hypothetical protein
LPVALMEGGRQPYHAAGRALAPPAPHEVVSWRRGGGLVTRAGAGRRSPGGWVVVVAVANPSAVGEPVEITLTLLRGGSDGRPPVVKAGVRRPRRLGDRRGLWGG